MKEDDVVVVSSDSEEDEEIVWMRKNQNKQYQLLSEKIKPILYYQVLPGYKISTGFPYARLQELANDLKKSLPLVNVKSTHAFIWKNVIRWLLSIKLCYENVSDCINDKNYNLILTDFMAQYVNYKCQLYSSLTDETEVGLISNEIVVTLSLVFSGWVPGILMTLLKIQVIDEYQLILYPIFRKYLSNKHLHETDDLISYLRLILCFRKWKKLAHLKEDKEIINEIAVGKSAKALKSDIIDLSTETADIDPVLPKTVPSVNDDNRAFANITGLIGFAAKNKEFGTRILLINKTLELDDTIEQFFKRYNEYINRTTPKLLEWSRAEPKTTLFEDLTRSPSPDQLLPRSSCATQEISQIANKNNSNEKHGTKAVNQHLSNNCDISSISVNNKFNNLNLNSHNIEYLSPSCKNIPQNRNNDVVLSLKTNNVELYTNDEDDNNENDTSTSVENSKANSMSAFEKRLSNALDRLKDRAINVGNLLNRVNVDRINSPVVAAISSDESDQLNAELPEVQVAINNVEAPIANPVPIRASVNPTIEKRIRKRHGIVSSTTSFEGTGDDSDNSDDDDGFGVNNRFHFSQRSFSKVVEEATSSTNEIPKTSSNASSQPRRSISSSPCPTRPSTPSPSPDRWLNISPSSTIKSGSVSRLGIAAGTSKTAGKSISSVYDGEQPTCSRYIAMPVLASLPIYEDTSKKETVKDPPNPTIIESINAIKTSSSATDKSQSQEDKCSPHVVPSDHTRPGMEVPIIDKSTVSKVNTDTCSVNELLKNISGFIGDLQEEYGFESSKNKCGPDKPPEEIFETPATIENESNDNVSAKKIEANLSQSDDSKAKNCGFSFEKEDEGQIKPLKSVKALQQPNVLLDAKNSIDNRETIKLQENCTDLTKEKNSREDELNEESEKFIDKPAAEEPSANTTIAESNTAKTSTEDEVVKILKNYKVNEQQDQVVTISEIDQTATEDESIEILKNDKVHEQPDQVPTISEVDQTTTEDEDDKVHEQLKQVVTISEIDQKHGQPGETLKAVHEQLDQVVTISEIDQTSTEDEAIKILKNDKEHEQLDQVVTISEIDQKHGQPGETVKADIFKFTNEQTTNQIDTIEEYSNMNNEETVDKKSQTLIEKSKSFEDEETLFEAIVEDGSLIDDIESPPYEIICQNEILDIIIEKCNNKDTIVENDDCKKTAEHMVPKNRKTSDQSLENTSAENNGSSSEKTSEKEINNTFIEMKECQQQHLEEENNRKTKEKVFETEETALTNQIVKNEMLRDSQAELIVKTVDLNQKQTNRKDLPKRSEDKKLQIEEIIKSDHDYVTVKYSDTSRNDHTYDEKLTELQHDSSKLELGPGSESSNGQKCSHQKLETFNATSIVSTQENESKHGEINEVTKLQSLEKEENSYKDTEEKVNDYFQKGHSLEDLTVVYETTLSDCKSDGQPDKEDIMKQLPSNQQAEDINENEDAEFNNRSFKKCPNSVHSESIEKQSYNDEDINKDQFLEKLKSSYESLVEKTGETIGNKTIITKEIEDDQCVVSRPLTSDKLVLELNCEHALITNDEDETENRDITKPIEICPSINQENERTERQISFVDDVDEQQPVNEEITCNSSVIPTDIQILNEKDAENRDNKEPLETRSEIDQMDEAIAKQSIDAAKIVDKKISCNSSVIPTDVQILNEKDTENRDNKEPLDTRSEIDEMDEAIAKQSIDVTKIDDKKISSFDNITPIPTELNAEEIVSVNIEDENRYHKEPLNTPEAIERKATLDVKIVNENQSVSKQTTSDVNVSPIDSKFNDAIVISGRRKDHIKAEVNKQPLKIFSAICKTNVESIEILTSNANEIEDNQLLTREILPDINSTPIDIEFNDKNKLMVIKQSDTESGDSMTQLEICPKNDKNDQIIEKQTSNLNKNQSVTPINSKYNDKKDTDKEPLNKIPTTDQKVEAIEKQTADIREIHDDQSCTMKTISDENLASIDIQHQTESTTDNEHNSQNSCKTEITTLSPEIEQKVIFEDTHTQNTSVNEKSAKLCHERADKMEMIDNEIRGSIISSMNISEMQKSSSPTSNVVNLEVLTTQVDQSFLPPVVDGECLEEQISQDKVVLLSLSPSSRVIHKNRPSQFQIINNEVHPPFKHELRRRLIIRIPKLSILEDELLKRRKGKESVCKTEPLEEQKQLKTVDHLNENDMKEETSTKKKSSKKDKSSKKSDRKKIKKAKKQEQKQALEKSICEDKVKELINLPVKDSNETPEEQVFKLNAPKCIKIQTENKKNVPEENADKDQTEKSKPIVSSKNATEYKSLVKEDIREAPLETSAEKTRAKISKNKTSTKKLKHSLKPNTSEEKIKNLTKVPIKDLKSLPEEQLIKLDVSELIDHNHETIDKTVEAIGTEIFKYDANKESRENREPLNTCALIDQKDEATTKQIIGAEEIDENQSLNRQVYSDENVSVIDINIDGEANAENEPKKSLNISLVNAQNDEASEQQTVDFEEIHEDQSGVRETNFNKNATTNHGQNETTADSEHYLEDRNSKTEPLKILPAIEQKVNFSDTNAQNTSKELSVQNDHEREDKIEIVSDEIHGSFSSTKNVCEMQKCSSRLSNVGYPEMVTPEVKSSSLPLKVVDVEPFGGDEIQEVSIHKPVSSLMSSSESIDQSGLSQDQSKRKLVIRIPKLSGFKGDTSKEVEETDSISKNPTLLNKENSGEYQITAEASLTKYVAKKNKSSKKSDKNKIIKAIDAKPTLRSNISEDEVKEPIQNLTSPIEEQVCKLESSECMTIQIKTQVTAPEKNVSKDQCKKTKPKITAETDKEGVKYAEKTRDKKLTKKNKDINKRKESTKDLKLSAEEQVLNLDASKSLTTGIESGEIKCDSNKSVIIEDSTICKEKFLKTLRNKKSERKRNQSALSKTYKPKLSISSLGDEQVIRASECISFQIESRKMAREEDVNKGQLELNQPKAIADNVIEHKSFVKTILGEYMNESAVKKNTAVTVKILGSRSEDLNNANEDDETKLSKTPTKGSEYNSEAPNCSVDPVQLTNLAENRSQPKRKQKLSSKKSTEIFTEEPILKKNKTQTEAPNSYEPIEIFPLSILKRPTEKGIFPTYTGTDNCLLKPGVKAAPIVKKVKFAECQTEPKSTIKKNYQPCSSKCQKFNDVTLTGHITTSKWQTNVLKNIVECKDELIKNRNQQVFSQIRHAKQKNKLLSIEPDSSSQLAKELKRTENILTEEESNLSTRVQVAFGDLGEPSLISDSEISRQNEPIALESDRSIVFYPTRDSAEDLEVSCITSQKNDDEIYYNYNDENGTPVLDEKNLIEDESPSNQSKITSLSKIKVPTADVHQLTPVLISHTPLLIEPMPKSLSETSKLQLKPRSNDEMEWNSSITPKESELKTVSNDNVEKCNAGPDESMVPVGSAADENLELWYKKRGISKKFRGMNVSNSNSTKSVEDSMETQKNDRKQKKPRRVQKSEANIADQKSFNFEDLKAAAILTSLKTRQNKTHRSRKGLQPTRITRSTSQMVQLAESFLQHNARQIVSPISCSENVCEKDPLDNLKVIENCRIPSSIENHSELTHSNGSSDSDDTGKLVIDFDPKRLTKSKAKEQSNSKSKNNKKGKGTPSSKSTLTKNKKAKNKVSINQIVELNDENPDSLPKRSRGRPKLSNDLSTKSPKIETAPKSLRGTSKQKKSTKSNTKNDYLEELNPHIEKDEQVNNKSLQTIYPESKDKLQLSIDVPIENQKDSKLTDEPTEEPSTSSNYESSTSSATPQNMNKETWLKNFTLRKVSKSLDTDKEFSEKVSIVKRVLSEPNLFQTHKAFDGFVKIQEQPSENVSEMSIETIKVADDQNKIKSEHDIHEEKETEIPSLKVPMRDVEKKIETLKTQEKPKDKKLNKCIRRLSMEEIKEEKTQKQPKKPKRRNEKHTTLKDQTESVTIPTFETIYVEEPKQSSIVSKTAKSALSKHSELVTENKTVALPETNVDTNEINQIENTAKVEETKNKKQIKLITGTLNTIAEITSLNEVEKQVISTSKKAKVEETKNKKQIKSITGTLNTIAEINSLNEVEKQVISTSKKAKVEETKNKKQIKSITGTLNTIAEITSLNEVEKQVISTSKKSKKSTKKAINKMVSLRESEDTSLPSMVSKLNEKQDIDSNDVNSINNPNSNQRILTDDSSLSTDSSSKIITDTVLVDQPKKELILSTDESTLKTSGLSNAGVESTISIEMEVEIQSLKVPLKDIEETTEILGTQKQLKNDETNKCVRRLSTQENNQDKTPKQPKKQIRTNEEHTYLDDQTASVTIPTIKTSCLNESIQIDVSSVEHTTLEDQTASITKPTFKTICVKESIQSDVPSLEHTTLEDETASVTTIILKPIRVEESIQNDVAPTGEPALSNSVYESMKDSELLPDNKTVSLPETNIDKNEVKDEHKIAKVIEVKNIELIKSIAETLISSVEISSLNEVDKQDKSTQNKANKPIKEETHKIVDLTESGDSALPSRVYTLNEEQVDKNMDSNDVNSEDNPKSYQTMLTYDSSISSDPSSKIVTDPVVLDDQHKKRLTSSTEEIKLKMSVFPTARLEAIISKVGAKKHRSKSINLEKNEVFDEQGHLDKRLRRFSLDNPKNISAIERDTKNLINFAQVSKSIAVKTPTKKDDEVERALDISISNILGTQLSNETDIDSSNVTAEEGKKQGSEISIVQLSSKDNKQIIKKSVETFPKRKRPSLDGVQCLENVSVSQRRRSNSTSDVPNTLSGEAVDVAGCEKDQETLKNRSESEAKKARVLSFTNFLELERDFFLDEDEMNATNFNDTREVQSSQVVTTRKAEPQHDCMFSGNRGQDDEDKLLIFNTDLALETVPTYSPDENVDLYSLDDLYLFTPTSTLINGSENVSGGNSENGEKPKTDVKKSEFTSKEVETIISSAKATFEEGICPTTEEKQTIDARTSEYELNDGTTNMSCLKTKLSKSLLVKLYNKTTTPDKKNPNEETMESIPGSKLKSRQKPFWKPIKTPTKPKIVQEVSESSKLESSTSVISLVANPYPIDDVKSLPVYFEDIFEEKHVKTPSKSENQATETDLCKVDLSKKRFLPSLSTDDQFDRLKNESPVNTCVEKTPKLVIIPSLSLKSDDISSKDSSSGKLDVPNTQSITCVSSIPSELCEQKGKTEKLLQPAVNVLDQSNLFSNNLSHSVKTTASYTPPDETQSSVLETNSVKAPSLLKKIDETTKSCEETNEADVHLRNIVLLEENNSYSKKPMRQSRIPSVKNSPEKVDVICEEEILEKKSSSKLLTSKTQPPVAVVPSMPSISTSLVKPTILDPLEQKVSGKASSSKKLLDQPFVIKTPDPSDKINEAQPTPENKNIVTSKPSLKRYPSFSDSKNSNEPPSKIFCSEISGTAVPIAGLSSKPSNPTSSDTPKVVNLCEQKHSVKTSCSKKPLKQSFVIKSPDASIKTNEIRPTPENINVGLSKTLKRYPSFSDGTKVQENPSKIARSEISATSISSQQQVFPSPNQKSKIFYCNPTLSNPNASKAPARNQTITKPSTPKTTSPAIFITRPPVSVQKSIEPVLQPTVNLPSQSPRNSRTIVPMHTTEKSISISFRKLTPSNAPETTCPDKPRSTSTSFGTPKSKEISSSMPRSTVQSFGTPRSNNLSSSTPKSSTSFISSTSVSRIPSAWSAGLAKLSAELERIQSEISKLPEVDYNFPDYRRRKALHKELAAKQEELNEFKKKQPEYEKHTHVSKSHSERKPLDRDHQQHHHHQHRPSSQQFNNLKRKHDSLGQHSEREFFKGSTSGHNSHVERPKKPNRVYVNKFSELDKMNFTNKHDQSADTNPEAKKLPPWDPKPLNADEIIRTLRRK